MPGGGRGGRSGGEERPAPRFAARAAALIRCTRRRSGAGLPSGWVTAALPLFGKSATTPVSRRGRSSDDPFEGFKRPGSRGRKSWQALGEFKLSCWVGCVAERQQVPLGQERNRNRNGQGSTSSDSHGFDSHQRTYVDNSVLAYFEASVANGATRCGAIAVTVARLFCHCKCTSFVNERFGGTSNL